MENINILIIVIASILAMASVFVLYAIIMFKGIKKDNELQLTTKNVLEQVKILFDKKEYPLVELLATKYLERVPGHFEVRKYLVKAYFQEEKFNSAIRHAQVLIKKNSNDYETMKILADCYIKKDNLTRAIDIYENLFDKKSRDNVIISTLAELYRKTEDTYSAISAYNILRDNTPQTDTNELAEIYSILAELNEEVRDYPSAFDAYKARLEILPADIETNKKLVELHIRLRTTQMAIEVLLYMLTFVTETRDLQWVYEKLIELYVQDEKYQNAIDYSEKLMELQSADKSKIRNNIAKYKICLGQYKDGITIYEELAVLSQNDYNITVALAEAYIACKEYEKALAQYMLLLDKSSSKETKQIRIMICDLYVKWAETLYESGKYDYSMDNLEKAKEYNIVNPEIYYIMACNKTASKNYLETTEYLRTALDYDKQKTNHIKYLIAMANAQHELGNQFEEKKAVTDLLKIDDKNIQGLLRIGIMYFSQHDTKSAEEYFKKVLALDATCDDAKYNLALIYETSNHERAKELYIEILEHNPEYKEAKIALEEMSSSDYY